VLIRELSLEIPRGRRLLGGDGSGKSALFRATAGLWPAGHGRILRPRRGVMFLPQRPYTVLGSLREQLLYGLHDRGISAEQLAEVIAAVKLEPIVHRVGGLAAERDWPNTLSLGEQQLLAFSRLLLASPAFAFIDQAVSALGPERGRELYELLAGTPITYVSVGDHVHIEEYHDLLLELHEDGSWSTCPTRSALPVGNGVHHSELRE
jgi:putative ATP-binding cassette transporter